MKIHVLDKNSLKLIGDRIDKDLASMAAELGLKVKVKRLSYEQLSMTVALQVDVLEAEGGKPAAQVNWENNARLLGLQPEWYGCKFVSGGKTFVLSGLDISKPARNVLATHLGKTFAFRADDLAPLFTARPPVKP